MNLTVQIAKQFRDVHFGGNWTASSLKEHLSDLNWQQVTQQVYSFNSIAVLVFHMNYYVCAVMKVLEGGTLDAHDKYSFDCPPILYADEWEKMLAKTWADAEKFTQLIEQLPEERLWENFSDPKYGSYYRNLEGVIEHIHYHLGQIVLIKKIIPQNSDEQQ